jgi:MFS family permease
VLIFGAWGGLVADRSDKRRLMIIVQTIAMLQSFALAALAFSGSPPVIALYAVALVGGFTIAFDNPARRSLVVEMVSAEHVPNAVSLNSAVMTGARVIGPAFAGLLITTVGFGWCFLLDGFSYIAVLIALGMMRSSEIRRAPRAESGKGQVRAGLRYVRTVPELWIPLVMLTLIGTLAFNFQVVMPLLVTRTFDSGDGVFTLLFSVVSLGSLLGALAAARRTNLGMRFLILSSLAYGITMLMLAAAPSLWMAFPIGFGIGWASVGCITGSNAIVQLRADPVMRGRVLALQAIVFLGSTPIGGPTIGWICEQWGPRAGVAVGGFACLISAVFGLWAARRHHMEIGAPLVEEAPELQVA